MRAKAINEIMKKEDVSYKEASGKLLKPEANDLPNHGIGRGRGDEVEDVNNLLSTRPGQSGNGSGTEAQDVVDEMVPAVEHVTDEMNKDREK